MKKNSGIIGTKRSVGLSDAGGIFDTFDAYNYKKSGAWPLVLTYNSLSLDTGIVLENRVHTFTLNTSGFVANTNLYWNILNETSTNSDFYNSVVSGSFLQSGSTNTGSFTVTTAFTGNPSKSTKTFKIQIRTGSTNGPVVFTSNTYSIPAIQSSVVWTASPIDEGTSVLLRVTLSNIGTFSAWSANVSYSSNSAVSSDFSSLPSNITVGAGNYDQIYTATADFSTEGTETLTATVFFGGNTLGSATLTINDTSTQATANITPTLTSVNEDSTQVTFNVSTTNFPSGTLYYTVLPTSGNVTSTDFTQNSLSGSFSVSSSTGSFILTIRADTFTEGTESFQVQVRVNSISGTVLGTSTTITINDTSVSAPVPSYITLGVKAPTLGSSGASTYPPTGYTGLQNASVDDFYVTFTTPFSVTINNTAYTTHYFGSNTYITWGAGSSVYSSLGPANPAQNKLMLGAADNSYQRVSVFTSGTAYTTARYEGNGSTSGSVGFPGIVLEVTFFNPANYGGLPVIEILVGGHNRTSGVTAISTPSTHMLSWTIAQLTSYVLVGNSTGTSWTKFDGFVNNR